MTNKQTVRYNIAAAFALAALLLTAAAVDARNFAPSQTLAAEEEPDFLVLDPKGE